MRAWIGEEMEGESKERTLFVECEEVTISVGERIVQMAKEHLLNRVYLGAGRKDAKVGNVVLDFLHSNGLEVVVETSLDNYADFQDKQCDSIVVRIECPCLKLNKNLVLKMDNMVEECAVSDSLTFTNISEVKNGMYQNDREVRI